MAAHAMLKFNYSQLNERCVSISWFRKHRYVSVVHIWSEWFHITYVKIGGHMDLLCHMTRPGYFTITVDGHMRDIQYGELFHNGWQILNQQKNT
jgi:hypothetical protein